MSLTGFRDGAPVTGRMWGRLGGVAAGVLVWLGLLALAVHKLFAYDVWWQIKAGEWIARHGIPATDPFSFAFPGRPWIEPRWLWCLLVHEVHDRLGLNYLVLLEVVLLGLAFYLLARAGDRGTGWAATLGLTMILATASERFMVRPELVSFLLLALTLLCLHRYRKGGSSRWVWALPVVQVAWSNAHTLWILGPAVQWLFVVGEVVQGRLALHVPARFAREDRIEGGRLRRLILVAAASTLATLINPYLLRGVVFPFRLFAQISSGNLLNEMISEFRGPFTAGLFSFDHRTVAYLTVIAVSLFGFVLRRRRIPVGNLLLWAAFLVLSVKAQRNVALFGFVAGFVTIRNFSEYAREHDADARAILLRRAATAAVLLYLGALVPLVATDRFYRSQGSLKQFGFGLSDHRFPVRALLFARQEGLPRPMLHALGDGGYVLWEGGPRSAYVDGRLEVYGSTILGEAIRTTLGGQGLAQEVRRTGALSILVPNDERHRPLLAAVEAALDWVPVYYDPLHLLYLRVTPETRALAERLGFDWRHPVTREVRRPPTLDPPDWLAGWWPRVPDGYDQERLGSLMAGVGNYSLARGHFEAAVAKAPRDRRSRLFLGLFREAEGREEEARRLWRGVPASYFETPEVSLLAARIQLWASRPRGAVERFERAIALGAPQPGTSIELARAALLGDDPDRAERELRAVVRTHPSAHEAWNLLALVAMRRRRTDEAVRSFEASLRIDPAQPRVCRMLAGLYAEQGAVELARKMEQRALELQQLRQDPRASP